MKWIRAIDLLDDVFYINLDHYAEFCFGEETLAGKFPLALRTTHQIDKNELTDKPDWDSHHFTVEYRVTRDTRDYILDSLKVKRQVD